jgi:hypothetical protein
METLFKCNMCEKLLSSNRKLEIHKEKCAIREKEFKCEFCDKTLCTKRNLENHFISCIKRKDKELKELRELNDLKENELKELRELNELKENELKELKKLNLLNDIKDNELKKLKEIKELNGETIIEKDKIIIKVNAQLEKQDEQLEHYKDQIKDLQEKLDKIANKAIDRPTTVTNTTTTNNNLNIMSSIDFNDTETIKDLIENKLDINHVVDGQKGLVQFLLESFLKDEDGNLKYKCTDASRNIFKYKNSDGEINKDIEAKKLIKYIVNGGIKVKSVEIAREWYTDEGIVDITKYKIMDHPQQLILTICDESSSFKKELASLTCVN